MVEWKIKGLYKASAEKVYSEIKELGESFSPADIVEAAKDKNSELHKCFTWNDTVAAEKWRKQEARVLTANLVIKVETSDKKTVNVRVVESTSTGYSPTAVVVKSKTDYADLLARAKAELQTFKVKYSVVEELQNIFEAIDEL